MNKKAIGSVLMILGTCIGAGMLALPVITAQETVGMTFLMLVFSWLLSTIGALALLEVSFWFKSTTHLSTMSDKTVGSYGKVITWLLYLLLLYSLISAYLSGLSGIAHHLLESIHIDLKRSMTTLLCLLFFGIIIYRGISSVDIINRVLMCIKLSSYVLLVALIAGHIHIHMALQGKVQWSSGIIMVMLTSFGYSIIIPSIRAYLDSDKKLIINVILAGSLIPLIIYSIWIFFIQSVIPSSVLVEMGHSTNTNGLLMASINQHVHHEITIFITKIFISICALTSFLGVSISLVDFLADGLNRPTTGKQSWLIYVVAYLPPLLLVLLKPGIFILALHYAGLCCLILLILFPLLMLFIGRYVKKIKGTY